MPSEKACLFLERDLWSGSSLLPCLPSRGRMLPSLGYGHKAMFATKLPHRGWCFWPPEGHHSLLPRCSIRMQITSSQALQSRQVIGHVVQGCWQDMVPKSFGGFPSKWSVEWHLNRKYFFPPSFFLNKKKVFISSTYT